MKAQRLRCAFHVPQCRTANQTAQYYYYYYYYSHFQSIRNNNNKYRSNSALSTTTAVALSLFDQINKRRYHTTRVPFYCKVKELSPAIERIVQLSNEFDNPSKRIEQTYPILQQHKKGLTKHSEKALAIPVLYQALTNPNSKVTEKYAEVFVYFSTLVLQVCNFRKRTFYDAHIYTKPPHFIPCGYFGINMEYSFTPPSSTSPKSSKISKLVEEYLMMPIDLLHQYAAYYLATGKKITKTEKDVLFQMISHLKRLEKYHPSNIYDKLYFHFGSDLLRQLQNLYVNEHDKSNIISYWIEEENARSSAHSLLFPSSSSPSP